MTNNVFVLNGPNLNLLGLRETDIYGTATLADLSSRCRATGEKHGLSVDFIQSNHEGELVEWIHEARDVAQGIVINAAGYTHTSVAIHDALRAYDGYKIELHISEVLQMTISDNIQLPINYFDKYLQVFVLIS